VKSYFYGDERKKIVNLLDEVRSVEGIRCGGELEALVVEARLIRRHEPKYNRRGKTWRRGAYLALDPREAWPRLKVVHAASPGDGRVYLGPFGSTARARLAKEALEETAPLHHLDWGSTRFAPARSRHGPLPRLPCDGAPTPSATQARPMARLLPGFQPGRSSARTSNDPPRRSGTLRRGSVRDVCAIRRGLAVEVDTWLIVRAGRARAGDGELRFDHGAAHPGTAGYAHHALPA
jgi:hypothetical protein